MFTVVVKCFSTAHNFLPLPNYVTLEVILTATISCLAFLPGEKSKATSSSEANGLSNDTGMAVSDTATTMTDGLPNSTATVSASTAWYLC